MITYAMTDAAGRVLSLYAGPSPAAQAAAEGADVTARAFPDGYDQTAWWWDSAAWAGRPNPPAPPSLTAGVAATWAGLPAGATVRVIDPATGLEAGTDAADSAGALSITLPAGPWRLVVNEAFPARPASFDIEVLEP